jgi:3-oxoadipate enol-lactonase
MPYVRGARGARIHYEIHGTEGPWIVLIMGIGASGALWLDLPARLARGETKHRVITIDNPGTGRSDPLKRPYSLARMASDVVRVMDDADIDRAFVVGLSMGGMIAQHLALRQARRLEGLVLLATSPGVVHGGLPRVKAIRSLLRTGAGSLDDGRAKDLIADLILARTERARIDEVLERVGPAFGAAPLHAESFLWQLLACTLHSTGRSLGRICTPTVVVTGDDDIVMGRWASHVLASRIPGAALEIVPSCGHGISFTHPESIERAIARLRDRARSSAARGAMDAARKGVLLPEPSPLTGVSHDTSLRLRRLSRRPRRLLFFGLRSSPLRHGSP